MAISLYEISKAIPKDISKVKFSGGDSEKSIQDIYDKLNEIIDSVNKQTGFVRSLASGKPGDIRVRRIPSEEQQTSNYNLEVRTDKGWAHVSVELNEE